MGKYTRIAGTAAWQELVKRGQIAVEWHTLPTTIGNVLEGFSATSSDEDTRVEGVSILTQSILADVSKYEGDLGKLREHIWGMSLVGVLKEMRNDGIRFGNEELDQVAKAAFEFIGYREDHSQNQRLAEFGAKLQSALRMTLVPTEGDSKEKTNR